jgi:hypothetical protein
MSLNTIQIEELLDIHINYINNLQKFKNKYKYKSRNPNFPENISENIIKEYINIVENRKCMNSRFGDLEVINGDKVLKIECKCVSSLGPISFGPTEKWNELYILDATDFINKKFKIYKINLSNTCNEFKNIKLNKKETFEDGCKKGIRPRLSFSLLQKELNKNISIIYNGTLNFNDYNLINQFENKLKI